MKKEDNMKILDLLGGLFSGTAMMFLALALTISLESEAQAQTNITNCTLCFCQFTPPCNINGCGGVCIGGCSCGLVGIFCDCT